MKSQLKIQLTDFLAAYKEAADPGATIAAGVILSFLESKRSPKKLVARLVELIERRGGSERQTYIDVLDWLRTHRSDIVGRR